MDSLWLQSAVQAVQARARIRPHIYQTPLIPSRSNARHNEGTELLFKAENFQLTGSFKIRGAMAKMSALTSNAARPMITASSGNHGIGAACAAQSLGRNLTVVLPETVAPAKLNKIQSYGTEIILHGAETGLAEQHAQKLAASGAYTYISPYNDLDIIAGQGSIGLEILEQSTMVDNIFVAMGGGGLISGIGSVCKAFSPATRIYGVSAKNSMALAESMRAGRVVTTDHFPTLADAVAGGMDDDAVTLRLASAVVHQVIVCDEFEIATALKEIAFQENMIVEGAAALAFAGYKKVAKDIFGQKTIVILCGANYDQGVITKALFD